MDSRVRSFIAITLLVVIGAPICQAVPPADPRVEKQVDEARALRLAGNVDGSIRALSDVLKSDPNHYRASYNLGLAYLQAGKTEPALQWFDKAAKLQPKSASSDFTIYNTYGWTLLNAGNSKAAEQQFLTGLKYKDQLNNNSRAKLVGNLGFLYMTEGDLNKAKPFLTEAAGAGNYLAQYNLKVLESVDSSKPPVPPAPREAPPPTKPTKP